MIRPIKNKTETQKGNNRQIHPKKQTNKQTKTEHPPPPKAEKQQPHSMKVSTNFIVSVSSTLGP